MTERKPLVLDPASGQPMELPEGDTVAGGGSGGSGGTWSQPTGTPITLAAGEESDPITHPSVTNERLLVVVWRDAAQEGLTNNTLDFDLADADTFALDGVVLSSGKAMIDPTEIGAPVYVIPSNLVNGELNGSGEYGSWTGGFRGSYGGFYAFDGVASQMWLGYRSSDPQWLAIDLRSALPITRWRLHKGNQGDNYNARKCKLQYSTTGLEGPWTDAADYSSSGITYDASDWFQDDLASVITARYWRLYIIDGINGLHGDGYGIGEFELYAQSASFPTGAWYSIHTLEASSFSFVGVSKINSLTHTATIPADTAIRALVSFDGGTTWKKWNGASWETHMGGLADIDAGNTLAQIEAGLVDYVPQSGDTALAIDWGLYTDDTDASPSIDAVVINYDEATRYDPASIGGYGSSAEFGVRRISPTQTKIKNLTGSTQKIHASVRT